MEAQETEALAIHEKKTLEFHECVIEKGQKTFVEVGKSLAAIRDSRPRLYRETHKTFEEYCRDRWGWSRQNAHELISASEIAANLSGVPDKTITSVSQARPLAKLPAEQQPEAWDLAQEMAEKEGKNVTARHVQDAVNVTSGKPHVSQNSGNNEWYTPKEFILSAKKVMGGIDLDPASSEIANKTVGAKLFYTKDDNGLEEPWTGRVWMNPPYAQPLIEQFCNRLANSAGKGVRQATVLVNNASETKWWQVLAGVASAICCPKGRIRFLDPDGNPGAPLQGQTIFYIGLNVQDFMCEFSQYGTCFKS